MKTKEHTAFFTGHRIIDKPSSELSNILETTIENLIISGVIYYGVGGAIGFDTLSAKTVISLRDKYPNIKLILVLPCKKQDELWNQTDKVEYSEILKQADKIVYISENYTRQCMFQRNIVHALVSIIGMTVQHGLASSFVFILIFHARHLVNFSSYCICYLNKKTGGTVYTVSYAKSKGLKMINLYKLLS